MTITYLRFVVAEENPDSKRLNGIFTIAYRLRDDPELPEYEREAIESVLAWFREHLPVPHVYRNKVEKAEVTVSWIKSSASEHVTRLRELAHILHRQRIYTRELQEKKVGYVLYEDDFQIVAEPFKDITA